MVLNTIGRLLIAFFFAYSAFNNIKSGLTGSAQFIENKHLPFPKVLAVLGLLAKILVAVSIATNVHSFYGAAIGILFLLIIIVFFKNPFVDDSNKFMALSLLALIGALLIIMSNSSYSLKSSQSSSESNGA